LVETGSIERFGSVTAVLTVQTPREAFCTIGRYLIFQDGRI